MPRTSWPIHDIVDIPVCDYLVSASTRTRSQQALKFHQIPASSDYYKFSFFPRINWKSLPARSSQFGILQTGAHLYVNINYPARPCKNTLVISLSYTFGDFVCPGTRREGSLAEGWRAKMHWPKLLFFWLSINYTSIKLSYFARSLSHARKPPRYSSQVWRQR